MVLGSQGDVNVTREPPPATHREEPVVFATLEVNSVPKNGTIVPEMGTLLPDNPIASALFSKNRRAVLALLFGHPDQSYYLRQIVRACGGGVGAVQRELRQLTDAGIIRRTVSGKQVYFQADVACPVFEELKGIVVKTAGAASQARPELLD